MAINGVYIKARVVEVNSLLHSLHLTPSAFIQDLLQGYSVAVAQLIKRRVSAIT